ncbi:MAG: hypothetical protein L3J17_02170 [Candidatus Jettenia sp.]|nr:MAG: hypothetical protein L3J17_02170 [Candidatus Jettenia sp.]
MVKRKRRIDLNKEEIITDMVTIHVKSISGEAGIIKKLLSGGLEEEKRRIKFAIEISASKIKKYEEKYKISTNAFIEKFKNREIEESDDTFNWWAEEKLVNELKQKLSIIENIEICQS